MQSIVIYLRMLCFARSDRNKVREKNPNNYRPKTIILK